MIDGFEIEFLTVGDTGRSGDCILVRYREDGGYKILAYDGGVKSSGEAMVRHIQEYYQTDTVDFLVNSHPDNDHASGLSVVLEKLKVKELWMHRPWLYCDEICHYFKDGRITNNSLARRFQEKMSAAYRLEVLATERDIPIKEPFYGEFIGPFQVLSPERNWYIHELVQEFNKTPEQKNNLNTEDFRGFLHESIQKIFENWDKETLKNNVTTSAENESSVILFANMHNNRVLLTGDAGVRALTQALDNAEYLGLNIQNCDFVQMPHHGSRNNVSPEVLDRLLGPRVSKGFTPTKISYVSVGPKSKTHPRQAVVNAFIRRGYKVYKTTRTNGVIKHHRGLSKRDGWVSINEVPFLEKVDA
jgi:beta-lactamase superfamily II metal-dependent hydrolase